jgi:hypothetical protein
MKDIPGKARRMCHICHRKKSVTSVDLVIRTLRIAPPTLRQHLHSSRAARHTRKRDGSRYNLTGEVKLRICESCSATVRLSLAGPIKAFC